MLVSWEKGLLVHVVTNKTNLLPSGFNVILVLHGKRYFYPGVGWGGDT